MKKILYIVFLSLTIFQFTSCSFAFRTMASIAVGKGYKGTAAESCITVVFTGNKRAIKRKYKRNPEAFLIEDTDYNYNLLHWAAYYGCYNSVKALLESGMNPNVQCSVNGETPLIIAADSGTNIKIIELLLEYGADANMQTWTNINTNEEYGKYYALVEGRTPLMQLTTACARTKKEEEIHLKIADLLIEKGNADINAKDINYETASISALKYKNIDLAHYLIVTKKADISGYYFYDISVYGHEFKGERDFEYPVNLLRDMIYDIDSDEYRKKMEIVKEFENQGISYRDAPISKRIMEKNTIHASR